MLETDRRFDAIIVGNGVAGHACARRLAQRGLAPLLVGPGLPYDRPPLTKAALVSGDVQPMADLSALAKRGISTLDGFVTSVDLASRLMAVSTPHAELELSAPALVLALGLSYDPPPVLDDGNTHTTATPEGALQTIKRLDGDPKDVAIIGAGLIGCETAATLATMGHRVTVVDIEAQPLARLHDPIPQLASSTLAELHVRFVGEAVVTEVLSVEDRRTLRTADGGELHADLVIAATGGRPVRLEGIADAFPIKVDGSMRMEGYEGVYAIGDCASPISAQFGRVRFPHWDTAIGTGTQAANAIAGDNAPYERMPYWWSDIGPLKMGEIGLAAAATSWAQEGPVLVGRDASDVRVCAFVSDRADLADARRVFATS